MKSDLNIDPARKHAIAVAVGTWSFSAHEFDPDELLYAALVILKHALEMPELEKWRMSTGEHISSLASNHSLLAALKLTLHNQTTSQPF